MSPPDVLFRRADKAWEAGRLRSAFRLFLRAAKAGQLGCQVNLGTFYCDGIGVKPNRERALYWYRRAYKRGDPSAATNIGCLYRDELNFDRALAWFDRATRLDDVNANLDMAKIYLRRGDRRRAILRLKRVRRAKPYAEVSAASWEEAGRMLKRLERAPR